MRSSTVFGNTWFACAIDSNTKPNSPACAKLSANNLVANEGSLKILASSHSTAAFTSSKANVIPIIGKNLLCKIAKFIPAPTVIKNSPKKIPLNGSKRLSISCR